MHRPTFNDIANDVLPVVVVSASLPTHGIAGALQAHCRRIARIGIDDEIAGHSTASLSVAPLPIL